jgi:hypothetical protein
MRFPPVICPDGCSWGTAQKQRAITPKGIGMRRDELTAARLHSGGQLYHCRHCGCVWEKYRDEKYDDWMVFRIGKYDGPGPELGFVLDPRLRDAKRPNPNPAEETHDDGATAPSETSYKKQRQRRPISRGSKLSRLRPSRRRSRRS